MKEGKQMTKELAKVINIGRGTSDAGHIYVLEVASGVCKIGASNNPLARIKNHHAALPEAFANVFISDRYEKYMELESSIHRSLKQHRIKSEVYRMEFSVAVAFVSDSVKSFEPAPLRARPTPTNTGVVNDIVMELTRLVERDGLIKAARELGYSDEHLISYLKDINPAAAAIALAMVLSGEPVSVEIAYVDVINSICNMSARKVAAVQ